jgi:acetolactate synthase-1/2/3 large subunit
VLVDIAKDVQEAEFDFVYPDEVDLPGWKPPHKVHPRQLREAARAIAVAQRPIVYAGGGVLNADACAELLELVDSAQLPAVVTLMGKGALPDSHPLNYGHPGMHGSKYANFALNKADLVIAVGSRFDDRVTGKVSAFAPGAKVIHFDIDAAEVGKIRHAEIPVVGPLKLALAQLATEVKAAAADGAPDRGPWLRQLEDWRAQFPFRYEKAPGVIKPQTAVEALRDLAATREEDVIWTTGVGQHQMWAMQYIQCDKPRSFITSGGLGTMGYGLPAAIGVQLAHPKSLVIDIAGEASILMNIQEMSTAVQYRLPVKIFILNNEYMGMVRQWQELLHGGRYSQSYSASLPDFVKLADAYGGVGIRCDKPGNLDDAIREMLAVTDRPVIFDCVVDKEENCFPMIPSGKAHNEMILGDAAAAVDIGSVIDEKGKMLV